MKHILKYKSFSSEIINGERYIVESIDTKKLKFIKKTRKKGAKTDTYDVIKDGNVIGQIKWSSRMRGYAFLPENDISDEIKSFVKDLMKKRIEDR